MKLKNKASISGFINNHLTSVIIISAGVISILLMILYSAFSMGAGFPLDDAWIHQTYARALATEGQWNYSLNGTSAGSTSPLWTFLLVPGYWLGFKSPYLWTFFISILCMILLFVFSNMVIKLTGVTEKLSLLLSGLILATEWHLIWAAGSGMETVLFTTLIVLVFYLIGKPIPSFPLAGLTIGMLVWIRPDGLTLLGPIGLLLFYMVREKKISLGSILQFIVLLLIPVILYGWHNYVLTGTIFPNTFFAKAVEYQEVLQIPFLQRLGNILLVPLTGSGFLLLPGFLFEVVSSIKTRQVWKISIYLWIIGFLLLYAIRLPVVYQHGRYLIPVIPMYFILAISGLHQILSAIKKLAPKLLKIEVLGLIILLNIGFLVLGGKAYARDVYTINKLLVEPANWLNKNTPPGSIIAAHDIGAIGYFSERKIIDLAGLINPEVIPFIRDEEKLLEYIKKQGVDYLVVLSQWYPKLESSGELIAQFELPLDGEIESTEIRELK